MKKLAICVFLMAFLQVPLAFAAPIVTLEDVTILPTDNMKKMNLWITGSIDEPVDSATFTVEALEGLSWGVVFLPLDGWSPVLSPPKFGSTDFGWPPNPIVSEFLFAEITLSWDFTTDSEFKVQIQNQRTAQFGFSFVELADDWAVPYSSDEVTVLGGTISAVPIPGAVWLLGSGLVGVIGLRRRKRS